MTEKIFHDQSLWKNVADLGAGWTRDLLVSSRVARPTEPPRPAQWKVFACLFQDFDAAQVLQDMAELRSIVKQQDKKIAALESRLSEFEGDVREIANDES